MRKDPIKYYKSLYPQAFLSLRVILNSVDPLKLMDRCQADEYDPEVADILAGLHDCQDPTEAALLAIEVFEYWFNGNPGDRKLYQRIGPALLEVKGLMMAS